ncbi:MAG: insulinase family protein [Armatimonadetes bacterium]|nr:insulinase family protein [Armatimonadota bacterium]
MTAVLALATVLGGPKVIEVSEPGCGQVVVQAFVKAPPNMSDREQAAWDVLALTLYDGTSEFSRYPLVSYGSQAGVPLKIEAWPDFLSIRIVEPKGGLAVGAQILESLCYRASLTTQATLESVQTLRRRRTDGWTAGLFNLDPPYDKVTVEQVRNLYAVAFRPENTTLVFGGELLGGEGQKEAARRFVAVGPAPSRLRFDRPARPRISTKDRVATFELCGEPLSPNSVSGKAKVLATFALGVGKDTSLFRIVRQQMRLSYRQEAVLWPSQRGWSPRFLFARSAADAEPESLAEVREALLKDVQTWEAPVLERAKAMARASFDGTSPVTPFWVSPEGRMTSVLSDRCAWTGINAMMTGGTVGVPDFTDVTVEELKAAASDLIDKAQGAFVPGG